MLVSILIRIVTYSLDTLPKLAWGLWGYQKIGSKGVGLHTIINVSDH